MHFKFVAVIFWLVTAICKCAAMDILMFGGNGFIGSHTSELLLSEGHKLTLINRNNWPWNTGVTVKPNVYSIVLDRLNDDAVDVFKEKVLIPRNYKPFDVVIDFSAYNLKGFQSLYDQIRTLCNLYIYISTDSVYEVCDPSLVSNSNLLEEIHSQRPANEEFAKSLNKKDKYGHKKLEIEEFLIEQRSSNNSSSICPYLILRLPDVLGERDSTQRWWKYQLWMKYSDYLNKPVVIPYFCRLLKTSYVYVKDISRFLSLVLKNISRFEDQILNFAYDEAKSLRELLLHMKQSARVSVRIDFANENGDSDKGIFYFPSVTRNGGLSVASLKKLCPEFEFTPWETMVHQIVNFYQKAFVEYPRERDSVAYSLCRDFDLDERQCGKFTTHLLVDAGLNLS